MNAFDELYREVILDHYKNPRNHGELDPADCRAEGMNPLCGDEITVTVRLGADGETIEEVRFIGRGCELFQCQLHDRSEQVRTSCSDRDCTVVFQCMIQEAHQTIVHPFALLFIFRLCNLLPQNRFTRSMTIGSFQHRDVPAENLVIRMWPDAVFGLKVRLDFHFHLAQCVVLATVIPEHKLTKIAGDRKSFA